MKLLYTVLLIPTMLSAQQDEKIRVIKEQQEITLIQPPAPPAIPPKSVISIPEQPPVRRSAPDPRPDMRPIPRPPMSIPWSPATERDCYTAPYQIRTACLQYVRDHRTVRPRTNRLKQRIRNATPRQREAIRTAREQFRREVDRILRSK